MNYIIDFFDLLLKPIDFTFYFNKTKSKITKKILYSNIEAPTLTLNNDVHIICDIPNYMDVSLNTTHTNIKSISIPKYQGSMITLTNYENLDQYLKHHFNAKKRSQFKTYKKRLEKSFNISYKVYYGNIDKTEYDRLFTKFPEIIKARFDTLRAEHYDLAVWDRYEQNAFSLINTKKACLFVIYDNNNPISISLTPVMGKVLYGFVRGFDVNYSKFYLGFTDILLQIEWCFENNIDIFDLLKGFFPYKNKFTNGTYFFQNLFIYNTKSISSTVCAIFKALKLKGFYFTIKLLKLVHIDTLYHNYSTKKLDQEKAKKFGENKTEFNYTIAPLTVTTGIEKYFEPIDINTEAYSFLKKPTYDTLYTSQEHIAKIEVYKETENSYIIKGVKTSYKITCA